MSVVLMVGLVVAIWRTSRLLVKDDFPPVRVVRDWSIRTFGIVGPSGELVGGRHLGGIGYTVAYIWTCSWCMSVWVGAGLVALADWRLSVPFPWLIVAAGSGLSGLLGMVEAGHDQRWALRQRDLDRTDRR